MKTVTRPPKNLNVDKLRNEKVRKQLEVKKDETVAKHGSEISISECWEALRKAAKRDSV